MCGIIGFLEREKQEDYKTAIESLYHRGPDDAGYVYGDDLASKPVLQRAVLNSNTRWDFRGDSPPACRVLLGHTRFALVDLTRAGSQPMISRDEHVALTFNGEIYNHQDLRRELQAKGHFFRSTSDTEVLLESYLEWGESCFDRFRGWWAIALWDTRKNAILLCRDRLGKAPLYLHSSKSGLRWASEIESLLVLRSDIDRSPDWTSVNDFIAHGLRDAHGATCFSDIKTLDAGSYAWVNSEGLGRQIRYWSLPKTRLTNKDISVQEACEKVRNELILATEYRIRADVPVALQLSGGLDSSVVLACAAQLGTKIKAVTVSFPEEEANEDYYAKAAANAYPGLIDHQLIQPGRAFDLDALREFSRSMGEPFHSPNQLSNRAIWQVLKALGYKAVLYGAAGDEVFAGYSNQYYIPYVRSAIQSGDFGIAASTILGLSERKFSSVDLLKRILVLLPGAQYALHKSTTSVRSTQLLYEPPAAGTRYCLPWQFDARMKALMGDAQLNYWLRTDNQNSMAVPIELRSPFLDHNVVEAAFTLPANYLIRDGWMKWILRKSFEKLLPKEIIWRRQKMGFPFPLKNWLTENRHLALEILGQGAPHIPKRNIANRYDANVARSPALAWRVLSYAIWWEGLGKA